VHAFSPLVVQGITTTTVADAERPDAYWRRVQVPTKVYPAVLSRFSTSVAVLNFIGRLASVRRSTVNSNSDSNNNNELLSRGWSACWNNSDHGTRGSKVGGGWGGWSWTGAPLCISGSCPRQPFVFRLGSCDQDGISSPASPLAMLAQRRAIRAIAARSLSVASYRIVSCRVVSWR